MLRITIPETELYDETTNEFITIHSQTVNMEHSLISISKWEAKWKKPFVGSDKTDEETFNYFVCMTINQNVDPRIYRCFGTKEIKMIEDYINDPQTATTFRTFKTNPNKKEIITSEIIYYMMIALNIPTEYEKWHLNRLLTLIKVCSIKSNPKGNKKMSRSEVLSQNRALNKARKAKYNTKG